MIRAIFRRTILSTGIVLAMLAPVASAPAAEQPDASSPRKAPPERTYSEFPFVHRIVLLDEDGTVIRQPKPGEEPTPEATKPFSMAKTCGKCHSDYDVMQQGWHFNFADSRAPHGRNGEPWILTDLQTRTQLPLSYRGWKGTFHPYEVGLNDFNFAKRFGRHHTGGGALQTSQDLRFKMSGPLENDCLICHTADRRYDPAARAEQIAKEQNYKYAPALAAFLGKVQGTASKLRDTYDPTGPDGRRAPKVNYVADRFDDVNQVHFDLAKRVPNERCYFCHSNLDAGKSSDGNATLESRWRHDQDIHIAKGMMCVDCHRNGADHMMVRGYEGEHWDRNMSERDPRADRSISTLTCAGCHYGEGDFPGGRSAAPRPLHRGLPTLHFDKLSCTACHSGPAPTTQATHVQTAMSHQLGLPRHHTDDAAAPTIQQPVYLRDERTGKITPNRVLYPSFWAYRDGDKLTPILPEQVLAAGVEDIFGEAPDAKDFAPLQPLTQEQITSVLTKLAAAAPEAPKAADAITARGATTNPTTAASQPPGQVVYVTGGKLYRLDAGKLVSSDASSTAYTWPLAHNVRSAQQSLGARGCADCHADGAPIFDSTVSSAAVIPAASVERPMHVLRDDSMSALRAFAATYPMRSLLIVIGYTCAGILALALLKRALRLIERGGAR